MTIAPSSIVPFVGRTGILRRLETMWSKGKLILLQAPSGAGKSMLIAKLAESRPILYAPRCGCLGDFLDDLEPQVRLQSEEMRIAPRVHRLAKALSIQGKPLVMDNVARVPPKVAHLVRLLMGNMPVWFVTRSSMPSELGHVWPYLFAFERIDLRPFTLDETRAFLTAAPFSGDRDELLAAGLRLHRLSAGHPATLAAIVAELGQRKYDLRTMEGLHLLALHARITGVQAKLKAYNRIMSGEPQQLSPTK